MATVLKGVIAASAMSAAALITSTARAEDPASAAAAQKNLELAVSESAAPATKATRRSGFVAGLALGGGVMSVVGYPNDARKIGFASSYHVTFARPAVLGELWLGGALSDWFEFGIGASISPLFGTGDNKAQSIAGMFHIEVFPLFPLGGHLRDVAVTMDFGTGTATLTDPNGTKLVDGAAASLIGGGFAYEGIRLWKIDQGPFLSGNYMWSDTVRRPAIFAGWRVSFHSGP